MYRGQGIIEEQEPEQGFSRVVTYRNIKTGLVEKADPYIMRVIAADSGGKAKVWERPAGSGNLFDSHGTPIGRWDKTKPEGERFLKDEKHIEWKAPETEDQKLARSVLEKDVKIQELERELAAIKAEKEKKSAPQTKKDQGA